MVVKGRGADFVAVLRDMAADAGFVDEVVEAARSHSPVVAKLPIAENRRHISVLLAVGLDSFERLRDPSDSDFAQAARLGADRAAQGIPISGLLSAIQAGQTRVLEIAIDRGRAAGIADDVLVEVLLDLGRYTGELERHVISGYHTAERELAHSSREARTRVLRRLLLGEGPQTSPHDLARLGLTAAGQYHCVVVDGSDPALLRPVQQRLTPCGGVFATVDGRITGLSPRLPEAAMLDADVLVVVSPVAPLDQVQAMYGLCVLALSAAARSGQRGVRHVVDLAGETALAAQPLLAELLRTELLGALDPADDFHRELAATALSYLDSGQRFDRTAAALHVHPNTVRYRLRRLREITATTSITSMSSIAAESGERLTVVESLRLWWALRDWLG